MYNRKFLSAMVFLAVLFIFSLTACKKNGPSGRGSGQATLLIMAYNPESSRTTYLKYLQNTMPDIKIMYEFVNLENFYSILTAQLEAGRGPDIIEVGGETKLLAKAGHLLDITDQGFTGKYADPGFAAYSVDGKRYATPFQSWYEGIFYNKKIFHEHELKIPKTLDEFIQLHKDLRSMGIKPQTMGAQSWEPMMKQSIGIVNNEFYANQEGKLFDELFDRGEAKLSDSWLPYVTEWSKMISEGCLTPDMLNMSYEQALNEFATGKAAMWECGPWGVNTIMERDPNFELGMFPIPGIQDGPGWLVGGPGSGLAINAAGKNREDALRVLDKTATPEAQTALIKDNAGSSFLIGFSSDLGDIYSDCTEAFRQGNVYAPWVAVWTAGNPIVEAYGKSLQEVLAGKKTIKEALEDADAINDAMRSSL